MKLVVVTGIFPPDHGGPASYVPAIASSLAAAGHAVRVVCTSAAAHDDGGYPFVVRRIRRGQPKPLRALRAVATLARELVGAELVFVNGMRLESLLATLLVPTPAVHKVVMDDALQFAYNRGWFRGTQDEFQAAAKRPLLRVVQWLYRRALHRARAVIVPSEYLRGLVVGWGISPDRVHVVYNAAEPLPDAPAAPSAAAAGEKTLVTVGRLVPWKGLESLVGVLPELPGTRLLLVGDGPLRGELERLARDAGVDDRVVFTGPVPRARVAGLLRGADAFVFNSWYEGLPHSVLEAMAAGLPVVSTPAGGTAEIVEHLRNAVVVKIGDDRSLLEGIRAVLADPALAARLAAQARADVARRFSPAAMLRATEAILEGRAPAGGPGESGALSVLSLGFARGLWAAGSDDRARLLEYARHLGRYRVVVHATRRHGLRPLLLAPNFAAVPTAARTAAGSFVRMLRLARRACAEGPVSLVQAQDPVFTGLAATLVARARRLPVNVCVYGSDVFDPEWRRAHWTHALMAPVGRMVLRRAHGVQVDGKMTARSLVAAGVPAGRIRVKPMIPANLDEFFALPRAPRAAGGPLRLLFVGRLARQKNLPALARVLRAVAAASPVPVELHVVGEGKERAAFEAAARGSGATLVMHGFLGRDAIAAAFAAADAFVLTSYYEGNPRVLMEAAAAGLPIVTTRVSGSDEAVEDGVTGFVLAVGDVSAHAGAVLRLARDPELRARMGAAARRRAREQLVGAGPGEQVRIWEALVRRHAAGPSPAPRAAAPAPAVPRPTGEAGVRVDDLLAGTALHGVER